MADTFTNSEIGRKLTDLISRDDFGRSYFYDWMTSNAAVDLPLAPGMTEATPSLSMILNPVTGLAADLANGVAKVQLVANTVTGQVTLATTKAQSASDFANSAATFSGLSGNYSNVSGVRADTARVYMEQARDAANTSVLANAVIANGVASVAGNTSVVLTAKASIDQTANTVALTNAVIQTTKVQIDVVNASVWTAKGLIDAVNTNVNSNKTAAATSASGAAMANTGSWTARDQANAILANVTIMNATVSTAVGTTATLASQANASNTAVTASKLAAANSATLAGVYAAQAGVYAGQINPANFITISSLTWANVASKPLVFNSDIANVAGLQAALDLKVSTASFTYSALPGKPTYFPTDTANVAGLSTALGLKADATALTAKADLTAVDTRINANVSTINGTLAAKADLTAVDTRINANVATLNTSIGAKAPISNPTFTADATVNGKLVSSSATQTNGINHYLTGGGTDAKWFRNYAYANTLAFDFVNDAYSAAATWLTVGRSGYSPTAINFTGTTLSFNGQALLPVTSNGPGGAGLAVYQTSTGSVDQALGDGLYNLVGGAYHTRHVNTSGTGHLYQSTRGASRIGLHDNTINLYVGSLASGAGQQAGNAVSWVQTMSISSTVAQFLVQPQYGGVNLTTANDVGAATVTRSKGLVTADPGIGAGGAWVTSNKLWFADGVGAYYVHSSRDFDPNTKANLAGAAFTGAVSVTGTVTATGNLVTSSNLVVGNAGGMFVNGQNHRLVFDAATGNRVSYRSDHATASGINLQTNDGVHRGALYYDGSLGLLNQVNGWRLRTYSGGASIYTDAGVENKIWTNGNIPNDAWQTSVDGKGRFWFASNGDSIWKTGNDHGWRNSADTTIMSLTAAGSLSLPSGNVRAVSTGGTGQFTAVSGSTMAGFYNDGTQFYILKSAGSNTTFDGHRPLYVNLSTGQVTIDGTGAATTIIGGAVQVGTTLRTLQSLDATTQTGSGMGVRVRARSDNVNAILQFTNTDASAQWTSLVSGGAGDLTCTTGFTIGGEAYANSWYRSNTSGTGWYHQVHGGGIFMNENTAVKVYGDKNFSTGGVITASNVTSTSDARFKRNIRPLETLTGLTPKRFSKDNREALGYIAQEVQAVAPEAVHEMTHDERGNYLTLDPLAVLAAVHSQLSAEIAELRARL